MVKWVIWWTQWRLADYYCLLLLSKYYFHYKRSNVLWEDEVWYHFLHNVIICGDIIVNKVSIQDNDVDIMIKSLPVAKFEHVLDLVFVDNFLTLGGPCGRGEELLSKRKFYPFYWNLCQDGYYWSMVTWNLLGHIRKSLKCDICCETIIMSFFRCEPILLLIHTHTYKLGFRNVFGSSPKRYSLALIFHILNFVLFCPRFLYIIYSFFYNTIQRRLKSH